MTMATKRRTTHKRTSSAPLNPLRRQEAEAAGEERKPLVHVYGHKVVCITDKRGHPTSRGRSPLEIVLDASDGFIPLWSNGVTLRWRFKDRSMTIFEDVDAAKAAIRKLLAAAIIAWGTAAPVKFAERKDATDFEIVVKRSEDCDVNGCTLAAAFFPDAGRHDLELYPTLFDQVHKEQVDTIVHELGHVFGLRHFFAKIEEKRWASEVFGTHKPFSIMNYGNKSKLTRYDRSDLKRLYQKAWSGELTEINGTPIRLVKPFSATIK